MTIKKRSIKIDGHTTSVSLEDEFWNALKDNAEQKNKSLPQLVAEIDNKRDHFHGGLSSALRVYILTELQSRLKSS